jgi:hypothetical protein
MSIVDPSLFDLALPAQDQLAEADLLGTGRQGASPAGSPRAPVLPESPAELGDDALVAFTAAAQNWFNTERMNRVPDSIISTQSMLSTLVGSMTADATEALATAGVLSPWAALSLTAP